MQPLEDVKGKESDPSLEPAEGASPADTFVFSPVRMILDFRHPDCKIINLC